MTEVKKITLNEPKVTFIEESHQYFLGKKELKGVTGTLIKKALGIDDLRFEIRDDRIAFPWFSELPEPDEVKAYTEFISLLCRLSKELKRASSAERQVTNEKYAFRCFLLRLGFIGSEYKTSRKILLRNLSGNSSWKNGVPEKETAICE